MKNNCWSVVYGTEIGTSGYAWIIGGTFKIGFNVDYFLQKTFGIGGS